MKIFNVNGDEWDRVEDRQGWRSKDAWVGARIEAELIGGSAYEVEPGDRLCPYRRELAEGDVVCFRRGKDGAHQVRNATSAPIRVLMLSTLIPA